MSNSYQRLVILLSLPALLACTDAKVKVLLNGLSKLNQKPYLFLSHVPTGGSGRNLITINKCYDIEIGSFDSNGQPKIVSAAFPYTITPGSTNLLYSDSACTAPISPGSPYAFSIPAATSISTKVYFKPTTIGTFDFKISNIDPTYQTDSILTYTVSDPILKIVGLPSQLYPNSCYQLSVGEFEADGVQSYPVPSGLQVNFLLSTSSQGQFYSTNDCASTPVNLAATAQTIATALSSSAVFYYKTPSAFTNILFDLQFVSGMTSTAIDQTSTLASIGSAVPQKALAYLPRDNVAAGLCFPLSLKLVNKDNIPVATRSDLLVGLSTDMIGNFYSAANPNNCSPSNIIDSVLFSPASSEQVVYFKALQAMSGTIRTNLNVTESTAAILSVTIPKSSFASDPWVNITGWPGWKKGSYIGSHELPVPLTIQSSGTLSCWQFSSPSYVACSPSIFSGNTLTIDQTNWQTNFRLTTTQSGTSRDFYFNFNEVYQRNSNSNSFRIFNCDSPIITTSMTINGTNASSFANKMTCIDSSVTVDVQTQLLFTNPGTSSAAGLIGRSTAPANIVLSYATLDSIKFFPAAYSYYALANLNIFSNLNSTLANHIYVSDPSFNSQFFLSDLNIKSSHDAGAAIEAFNVSQGLIINRVNVNKAAGTFTSGAAMGLYGIGDARLSGVQISMNPTVTVAGNGDGINVDNTALLGTNIQEFSNISYLGYGAALDFAKTYTAINSVFNANFLNFENIANSDLPLIRAASYVSSIAFYSSRFANHSVNSTVLYNGDGPGFAGCLFYNDGATSPVIQKTASDNGIGMTFAGNHFYKSAAGVNSVPIVGTSTGASGGISTYGATSNLFCKNPSASGSWQEFLGLMGGYPILLSASFTLSNSLNPEGFCEVANP